MNFKNIKMIDNGYLSHACGNCGCGGSVTGDCSCDEIYLELSKINTDLQVVEEKIEELEISGGVTTEKVTEMLEDYTYDKDEIDGMIEGIETPDNLVASIVMDDNDLKAKNINNEVLSSISVSELLSGIRVENNTLIIP